jgi:ABC-type lipoprotein export system ATPase subunit
VTRAVDVRDVFRIHRTAEGDAAALQGLTLAVEEGEVVVVLGPSGAGKSTLLRILAALEPISAGTANVFGTDIGSLRGRAAADYRAGILGMIDQHYTRALPPDVRVEDVIGLQLALRGEARPQRRARARELLEAVGLSDAASSLPGELSGGEQQRVAVCAALAHRPRLLLADEPSGELDRANGDTVYRLIRELVRDQGTTAVIVSHDHGATAIADRTVRIRDGRLSEEWHSGQPTLVVGHGGWVHLPEHLRAELGITSHVSAEQEGDGIVLRPVPGTEAPPAERVAAAASGVGSEAVAALRQVSKAYGKRALFQDMDAEFRRGAMTAVVGRSGSGKSTMLAMLAGLERPDRGEVLVLGRPLSGLDRTGLAGLRRTSVAYVGQEPGLVGFLSAEENVAFTLGLRGVPAAAAAERARDALVQVGLGARRTQRAARLSAGERQRVAIARALAAGADLLLVDEPTSRLDQANAESVAAMLAAAADSSSVAIVCATHDPLLIECAGVQMRLDDEAPDSVQGPVTGAGAGTM